MELARIQTVQISSARFGLVAFPSGGSSTATIQGGLLFYPLSNDPQTIFRVHRNERDRFAQIDNSTIRDKRLSFKATGLLCYLLSLPGDWKVSQNHLATVKTDGRDSVIAGFKELQACGYIEKQYDRAPGGQIKTTIWHVYEVPKSDLPISAEPESVLPISVNPTLQRAEENEEQKRTKNSSSAAPKENESSIQSKVAEAQQIYAAYPRKVGRDKAIKVICKALKRVPFETMLAAVRLYAESRQDKNPNFTPHPATWFSQGRYEDDPQEWQREGKPRFTEPEESEHAF